MVGSGAVGYLFLSSVGPNVVPGNTPSSQPVTEGSWHRTSGEGMNLESSAHVDYFYTGLTIRRPSSV